MCTGSGSENITLNHAYANNLVLGLTSKLPFVGQTYTIDKMPPIVVISSTASDSKEARPNPITLTFSENVTKFIASDLTVSPGSVANFTVSGSLYTFILEQPH